MHTGNAITTKRSCGRVPFLLLLSVACAILLALAAPVLAQPAGCPPGMTGYWKFDESSGGPYDDFFGTNNATCTNCPTTVTGKLGNGVDFDGINDRVDVPDDGSFDWAATSSFTIEFWMRSSGCVCTTGGFECNQVIAGRSAAGWWIGVNCQTPNTNKLRCYFGAGADLYSNASVNDDVWHHIVYQFDVVAGQYRLYIDGSLDNSISAGGVSRAGDGPIQLGYYSTAYQYYGMLDEFAVYNQVLSLSDIVSHYNSGSGQAYCASNQAPVVTDIPNQTIAEGSTFTTISLDGYVSDPDNTDAEMTWTYSGNTALTVSIDGSRIATITIPNTDWNGAETITFTATDPGSLSDSDPATFTVTAVNDAPVVTDIPDQTIAEGSTFTTISLDNFVSDVDNTDEQMTWSYSGNSQLTVSIVSRVATITIPNSEWSGSETITFTATDPGLLGSSDPATFTVTAVNDAPVVTDIPPQTIAEGGSFATIALDDHVSDADNTDAQMIWTYSGNTALTVSIDGSRIATITTPNSEWSGSETITFTATDPGLLSDSDPAIFTVTAVNDAPVVTDIPDQTIAEGGTFTTITLDNYVSDIDNTDEQMTWTYSGNSQLTVSIASRVATITTPNGDWNGAETITFTATDPGSLSDSDPATFTVTAVNSAPVVTDIPPQTIAEGGSFATIALDDYVSDADNTDAQMIWTYSGNSALTVSIDGSRTATITTPNSEWSGSETITFTATDPGSLSDSDPAIFTVTAVNDAPVVTDIPNQTIVEGNTFATISLDNFVSDVDNTDAQMIWTHAGNSQLAVSIVGRVAVITIPNADWNGAETITFTATDPGLLSDSDPATFTVTAVNDAPVVTDIPPQTIAEGGTFATIALDNFVSDVDNTDAQMTWAYSGNSALTVSIDGSRIATITTPSSEWSGSETITFTATDPGLLNDSDPATFTVTAVNDAPVVTGIPDQTIAEGGTFATITLDDYVSDVDNADAEMNWTYSFNSELTVSIVNRVATITIPNADWNGAETITFTATDPGLLGSSDPATFTVTAVNDAPVVTDIPPQTIAEGGTFTTITLDNFVSDADNTDDQMTWTYSGNTELTVSIDGGRVATITMPNTDWNGAETITFTATDPGLMSDSDPATFTVTAVNDAPVVTNIPNQTIVEGNTFATIALDNYVSDPDHTDAQMIWTYAGNTELTVSIDITRIATITTPSSTWTGGETITFTATDPDLAFASDEATFTVLSPGCPDGMIHYWQLDETSPPPLVDSYGTTDATCTNCPTPVAGIIGGAQEFDRLTDLVTVPDDNTYDWSLTSDYTIEFWLNKSIGCAGSAQGNNEVIVGRSGSGWWIGVMCESGTNQTKVRAYFAGVDLYSTTSVTDGEWHHVAFVRNNTAGQWRMYIDGNLEVSETSAGRNLASSGPLSIGWFDGPDPGKYRLGAVLDELALYSSALSGAEIANHHLLGHSGLGFCELGLPPAITSTPVTTAIGNRSYTYDVDATGTPAPIFSLTTSPAGMTIDSLTGVISWIPTALGSYPVSVSATNAAGFDVQPFSITVSALAPLITSTPVTTAIGGQPYEYDVEASAVPAATYFVFGTPPAGLPAGLTYSPTTGLISWPFSQPGNYPISIQALNQHGVDSQSYVLTVAAVAPLIISSPPLVGRTGSLYRYQVQTTGLPKPFFYLDIAPSGMEIDSVSGEITWLPAVAASYPVKIRVVNDAGDDSQTYILAISQAITECSPSMVQYWRLNESSGPSYANFLTTLTATCVGACPTGVAGNVDGGQRFGSGNVGLQVADNGTYDWLGPEELAIEFWMRRDITPAVDSNEVIVGRWGPQWWIGINHDGGGADIGKLRCSMAGVNLLSSSTVNDDFWHHVAVSRKAGIVSLYLDGALQSSAPSTASLAADDPMTMGYLNTGSPVLGYLRYKGILDEVALYNDDLPLAVISAHYNGGLGGRYCARCGDCDANGHLTISDVVCLINYIFSGGAAPEPLLAGDNDCSNMVTISDVVHMINFIFAGGAEPCASCK